MTDRVVKYTVELFGESYSIVSDEPEADVLQAVDHFNQYMQVLVAEAGVMDAKKVALLTGLHLSQELLKLQQRNQLEQGITGRIGVLIDKIDSELEFSETKTAAKVV